MEGIELDVRQHEIRVGPGESVSIAVWIRNRTEHTISFSGPHERYGGEWPTTPLHARDKDGELHPLYLYGEDQTVTEVVVDADGYEFLDVRLDWPGTGSAPVATWIDPAVTTRLDLNCAITGARWGRDHDQEKGRCGGAQRTW